MKKFILCIIILCIITVVSCDKAGQFDQYKNTHWLSEDGTEFYFNEDGTEFLSSSDIPWYVYHGGQFCRVSFMKGGKEIYEARNISFNIEGETLTLVEDEEIIQKFTKIELSN